LKNKQSKRREKREQGLHILIWRERSPIGSLVNKGLGGTLKEFIVLSLEAERIATGGMGSRTGGNLSAREAIFWTVSRKESKRGIECMICKGLRIL